MYLPFPFRRPVPGGLAESRWRGKRELAAVLRQVVDTVFPPACLACAEPTETALGLCGPCWRQTHFLAGAVCDLCGTSVPSADGHPGRILCEACTADPPPWDRGRAAVAYEGVGRRIVLGLKHGDRLDLAGPLARWLSGAGAEILDPDDLLVPVPLHKSRLARRGFNQASVLAHALAKRSGGTVLPTALVRIRNTRPQEGDRAARMAAMDGAVALAPEMAERVSGRPVVLIDDVMTSGATLSACARALRPASPSRISVLTVARVAREL